MPASSSEIEMLPSKFAAKIRNVKERKKEVNAADIQIVVIFVLLTSGSLKKKF